MSEHEPFSRLRSDHGSIRTSVEEVMTRGRVLRRRRHLRNSSLAVVTSVGALVGLTLGLGVFTAGHGGDTRIVASPSPDSMTGAGNVSVPMAGKCLSGTVVAVSAGGPVVELPNLPAELKLPPINSTVGTSAANCTVPPVALVFSVLSSPQTGAVVLWGPGAVLSSPDGTDGAGPSPSAHSTTNVHGQTADVTVTAVNGEVSWREANGSSWVLIGRGVSSADLARLANAIGVDPQQNATLPDPASFGLKAEAHQAFPAAGGTATIWETRYEGGGRQLTVTIVDNGVQILGELAVAAPANASATLTTVRGHQALLTSSGNETVVTWAETPSRTVTVNGPYSATQVIAIAEGLVIR